MNITELIKNTLEEIQNLMQTKTVVGEPITAGEHTIVPVSKVTFGFGGGGGDSKDAKHPAGGEGIGGGWSIEPVAFVVVGKDGAKLLTIGDKESVTGKLFDLAPKVMETVKDFAESKSNKKSKIGQEKNTHE